MSGLVSVTPREHVESLGVLGSLSAETHWARPFVSGMML